MPVKFEDILGTIGHAPVLRNTHLAPPCGDRYELLPAWLHPRQGRPNIRVLGAGMRLLITVAFLIAPIPLRAAAITYSTTTSQLCVGASGCNVSTQTIGTVTVTFNSQNPTTVAANLETYASFGELQVSCFGGGSACSSQSLTGLVLYLNISQTIPSVGTASIIGGTFAGSVSGTTSTTTVSWTQPNGATIGIVTYALANTPLSLVPPATGAGKVSIQGALSIPNLLFSNGFETVNGINNSVDSIHGDSVSAGTLAPARIPMPAPPTRSEFALLDHRGVLARVPGRVDQPV